MQAAMPENSLTAEASAEEVMPCTRPIRVVHLLGGPVQSGAGRGALALHEALLDLGVDSTLVHKQMWRARPLSQIEPFWILGRTLVGVASRLQHRLLARQVLDQSTPFLPISIGLAPQRMNLVRNADILHVQWAHAHVLGPSFWRWLATAPVPVLFTLRDAWSFTGGCHFPGSCHNYERECANCPLLGQEAEHLARRDFATKRQAYRGPVTFVAISEQIARCARASAALQGCEVILIPNAIQIDQFSLIDKGSARAHLGLPEGPTYLAAGAINLTDPRKGADVLRRLLERFGPESGVHWLLFGGGEVATPSNASKFGYVTSNEHLNRIYAAADLFVMPSIEEAFGKTTAEAMASGTPALAFRETPAEEIIMDDEDGWLTSHGDSDAMGNQVACLLARGREVLKLAGLKARASAVAHYSPAIAAKSHLALYERLLATQWRRP
jgi:glycosyltransferase involved in cell wall biosynthesis